MRTILNDKDILDRLPHRHENIIVDEVACVQDGDVHSAEFVVTLSPDNPQRALFLRTLPTGEQVVIAPVFMEILALASVACTPKTQDQLLIYAGISMFKKIHDLRAGERASGVVVRKRGRGVFINCEGHLCTSDNTLVCTSELTAALIEKKQLSEAADAPKRTLPLPDSTCDIAIDKSLYGKDERMVVSDAIVHIEPGKIVTRYTYPESHPFVRGHFPGNPIMMGIMQWMAIEDALQAYVWQMPPETTLPTALITEGVLVRTDGVVVAEIKGCKALLNGESVSSFVTIVETKKIIFRESLRPGETVFAILSPIDACSA